MYGKSPATLLSYHRVIDIEERERERERERGIFVRREDIFPILFSNQLM